MQYIPALKYHFLTPIYDWFIAITMPEQKFKSDLVELITTANADKILDFGSGTATLTCMIKNEFPASEVFGLDVDAQIMAIAEKKIKKYNLDINLQLFDGEILPYKEHTFGIVVSSLVFHHLTSQQKINAFAEIRRVLKPNGVFLIADWGKSQNCLMRILFYILQVCDNFYTTNDNVKGKIPDFLAKSGMKNIDILKNYATIFGTLSFFSSQK